MKDNYIKQFENGRIHTFSKSCNLFGDRVCSIQVDDPEYDCTYAAHPAYQRGVNKAVKVLIDEVYNILDIKDITLDKYQIYNNIKYAIKELKTERNQFEKQIVFLNNYIKEINSL